MTTLTEGTGQILWALFSTLSSLLAFALVRFCGAGMDASMFSGLILAGFLNIRGLWSLNCDQLLPTSETELGS
jgi:hypothetical protein